MARNPASSIWERTQPGDRPTAEGWYRDPATGGTRYWDGSRWSGDTFQLAKDNLLGAAEFAHLAHIAKLAELHRAGTITDFEFAAAKAKALGLA